MQSLCLNLVPGLHFSKFSFLIKHDYTPVIGQVPGRIDIVLTIPALTGGRRETLCSCRLQDSSVSYVKQSLFQRASVIKG